MDRTRTSRRRVGVILGLAGLAFVFGSGLILALSRSSPSVILLGAMLLGLGLLVAGFATVPRRR